MASSAFKASERFRVSMVNSDGGSERVTVQLSLEGLQILSSDGSRAMRKYNLRNVARWDLLDTRTVIWTKTDVDLEEKPLTLTGDSTTIRNVVDTLASCCMQLAEVINNKEEAANLEELAAGGGRTKKAQKLPSVDSVEYWRGADKSGWLQAQSDVMKIWRRRWFVLKQGYLFRFLSPDVSESVKPRGVVDLAKVQDVRDGRAASGKANTIQLKTASGGSVCYVCESETEMVEWISALEGAVAKIVKQLAGVDEPSSTGGSGSRSSSDRHRSSSRHHSSDRHGSSSASEWAKQVERSLSQSSSGRRGGSGAAALPGYGSGSGGRASAPVVGGYQESYGITDYGQVSGVAGVASALDDLTLNYGGYQGGTTAAAGAGAGAGTGGYGGTGTGSNGYGGGSNGYGAYGSGSTANAGYGGGSNNAAAYGGSAANAAGYGGGSSLTSYGSGGGGYGAYSSSPAVGGYGGSGAAAAGGYGSSGYADSAGYYSSTAPAAAAATPAYADPAAAAGGYGSTNGYGGYQQQQQQPQQQQPAGSDYYGAAAGYGSYQQQQQQQQPQPQQQQQQQQQPAVSLLDQVPSQQPAYPYYQAPAGQEGAAAPAAAAPPAPAAPSSPWQVHHTGEGRPYYHNSATGTTQWEAPPGL